MAEALRAAAAAGERVEIRGAGSKSRMGTPVEQAAAVIETTALAGVRQYEPRDLTVSVEAGMRWRDFCALVAAERQMAPLDPPCAETGTVGGVVAANLSGPRRRLYGAARDMVIGMNYATVDGLVAQTGGMVVKNVAGLDVHKALIGSFGTLAVITVVNFKLAPLPEATRTYVLACRSAAELAERRNAVLGGPLQPAALEAMNPEAARQAGLDGFCLLVRAGGPASLLSRYDRELEGAQRVEGKAEEALWRKVEEFAPSHPFVVRVGHKLSDLQAVMESAPGACLSRAGTGVSWLAMADAGEAQRWMMEPEHSGWTRVLEWSSGPAEVYWPDPGPELEWMRKLKSAFDPAGILNPGRLYGRI